MVCQIHERKFLHESSRLVQQKKKCRARFFFRGAKIFKRKAIEQVINELGITQWGFDVDLLYRLNRKRFKIKEVPTVWEDKEGSKLNLKRVPIRMFASVVRLRIVNSPFKGFIRLYNRIPEKLKFHHLA